MASTGTRFTFWHLERVEGLVTQTDHMIEQLSAEIAAARAATGSADFGSGFGGGSGGGAPQCPKDRNVLDPRDYKVA